MELNTEYWGTGSYGYQIPNDFAWAGNGSVKTLAQLWNNGNGPLVLNEHIDPSVFYCYSYASKLASYQYATLTYDGDWDLKNVRKFDSPFANYGFTYRGYSGENGIFSPSRQTSTPNYCVGYGISSLLSGNYILTKYALARIRYVCYVQYCYIDSYSDTIVIINGSNVQEIQLKDFLNNSTLMTDYNNGDLVILALKWFAYVKNTPESIAGTSYSNLAVFTCQDFKPDMDYTGEEGFYLNSEATLTQGGYAAGTRISSSERYKTYCFENTSDKWQLVMMRFTGSGLTWAQPCLLPNKLEDAFHEFAYTGLFYTNNTTTAANTTLADADLYWGIIAFGKTSGKYKQGNPNWSSDEAKSALGETNPPLLNDTDPETDPNPDYIGQDDPSQVDPNDYSISTPLTPPTLTTINVFNRSFAMTANQISSLADWLWNADEDKFIEIKEGLALMGENPMNGLIDCRLYPFAITDMIGHAGYELIVIGRTESTIGGVKLENSANCIIDLGECTFFAENKNFLDYSPYTQARLYLPYCGWHNIDPAEFMGKRITGKLIVDVITGTCNCIIYADDVILINATGAIGVEIPMTGTDSASFASQTLNAAMQCISKTAETVGMIAGGAGAISKGASLMNSAANTGALSDNRTATYLAGKSMAGSGVDQIAQSSIPGVDAVYAGWKACTVPVQYEMAGAATPACANWLPQYAYFVIDRPVPLIPDNYGHTIGFACCESGQLSGYSGFTVCSNVDTSGFAQATEAERAELKALLEAGVYL